jgi:hypothetical protein
MTREPIWSTSSEGVLRTFVVNCLAVYGKVFEQLALIHALASSR